MLRARWDIVAALIKENGFKRVAEIGVDCGDMGRNIIKVYPNLERYFLVDISRRRECNDILGNPVFEFLVMSSATAALTIEPGSLDLVFIDANHSYENVRQDIDLWFPKIRNGGILSGHDYCIEHPGVMKSVKETFSEFDLEVDRERDQTVDCVWWVRKKC